MDHQPRPKAEQTVSREQAGQPLAQLVAAVAQVNDVHARELIARGAVWLDRRRVLQPELGVAESAHLAIHFPPSGHYDAVRIELADIIWEDESLLALNKQPGWHANYTPWDMWGTIPWMLAAFLQQRDGFKGPLHLAHQLDRDTSGVLLVSKEPAVNPGLQQLFLQGGIAKTYLALATGQLDQSSVELVTGHGRGRSGLFRVYPLSEVGQQLPFGNQRVRNMHTQFAVLARQPDATLVQATPITGRTHQIRLHLAHLDHPIVGDTRYGGAAELCGSRVPHHLLHAARLSFTHPLTHRPVMLSAPLPGSWHEALRTVRMPVPDEGRLVLTPLVHND